MACQAVEVFFHEHEHLPVGSTKQTKIAIPALLTHTVTISVWINLAYKQ